MVASAWLDKDLKYTLRFVSKSVFGFLATIALVVRTVEWRTVEWTNYEEGEMPEECQNICIPGVTGPNPENQNFTKENAKECDKQELALDKRFAGHSSPIFLTISKYISLISY